MGVPVESWVESVAWALVRDPRRVGHRVETVCELVVRGHPGALRPDKAPVPPAAELVLNVRGELGELLLTIEYA